VTVSGAGDYFALDPSLVAAGEGRYFDLGTDVHPVEFVPGLEFRPVIGERMLVNFVHYAAHTEAPSHAHEEEQVTFVIDGEFEFDLDGDVRVMKPGMAVYVPAGVPHGAKTLDSTCYEIDVFSPPRKVLVDAAQAIAAGEEIVVEPPEAT
jgi:quercetin dioxygenase-like cupin family protein